MKKIGLMGCGVVAGYGHIPAIQQVADLDLCAIYDPNAENLKKTQQDFGIPLAFADVEAFFASGIEAVSITSPAPCHLRNVIDAARHRLPVLCEKPLATDQAEAAEMIAAMHTAGVSLHTAFCYRFGRAALKIRDLVAAGAIGDVRSLRLIYVWDAHGKYARDAAGRRVIQKRRADRMIEGGPMVDCGTHQIDLARFWLRSEVVRCTGHGAWVDEYEAPDHMWLHMDHANGAHTVVEISYSYYHTALRKRHEFVYELIGTKGVIRYDRECRSFTMETDSGSQVFEFADEKDFRGMYAEWAAALAGRDAGLLPTGADGLRATELARVATEDVIRGRVSPERKD